MRLGGGFKKTPPAAVSVGPSSQAPGVKAAGTDAGTKPLGSLSKPPKPTRPAPPKSTPPASPTNQTPAQIGKKLENLGIRKPDLQGLDGSDLKALDQATSMWGTGKDGRHQGIRHIQDYALGKDGPEKMGRLTRLKDILGGGPYSAQDPRSITKVTQTLQSNLPAQGSPYHRVSSNEEGVKNIFFLRSPGATGDPTNSTKGIVVIEFDGKLQSFFNTEFGKFKKLK